MKLFTFSHHGSCLAITCFQRICANVQNRTYSESLHLVNSNTRVKDKIQCRLYVLFQNHHLQNDYVIKNDICGITPRLYPKRLS